MDERSAAICDLLLGAAHADDEFHDREVETILELLAKIMKVDEAPPEVAAHINEFDPNRFDLEKVAATFSDEPEEQKNKLLELVASVHDSDDEYALAEDDYLRELGAALELDPAVLDKLTLDYEVEDLQESFSSLRKNES
jgi:uncharacterized tellurite resistance protein B-like protein